MINIIMFSKPTREKILFKLASVAHICYSKECIEDMMNKLKDDEIKQLRLVSQILKSGHHSILEHVSFTFGVEGISRNCTHQIVRHRNMSFAQQSFHYTIADSLDIPDIKHKNPLVEKEFMHAKGLVSEIHSVYKNLVSMGMPKEDARHILPGGQLTRIIITANLRQWLYFVNRRECGINCSEIQLVAKEISYQLCSLMPFIEDYIGPDCKILGKCREARPCIKN